MAVTPLRLQYSKWSLIENDNDKLTILIKCFLSKLLLNEAIISGTLKDWKQNLGANYKEQIDNTMQPYFQACPGTSL